MNATTNTATNQTTIFAHYKSMVAEVAGVTIDALEVHRRRLNAAFDIGEPVWMIADEIKLRCSFPAKHKSPRELAARIVSF
jgi:hypothetical protein